MAIYIHNCYSTPSRLFVAGKEILSSEGTTQGDPLAMPVYAIGITPLLSLINATGNTLETEHKVKHAAFADDLGGTGKLQQLREWWDKIVKFGPLLGYYPNASKSWLIVKSNQETEAKHIFNDTELNITIEGRKYLGGYIGTNNSRDKYAKRLVQDWIEQINNLSKIALTEPQAAYAAFVSGFQHKLTYYIRTIPGLRDHLKILDETINNKLIPSFTNGQHCTPDERKLLSLPVRLGGLSIPIFADIADREFENSKQITSQLSTNIKNQIIDYTFDQQQHNNDKKEITKARDENHKSTLINLRKKMSPAEIRANDLAQLKGASSWLNALPLKSENYVLNKREFHDAICLRYRWQIKYLPTMCACGKVFSVDHAMSCTKGGFIHQRHDEVKEILASLTKEICNDVEIEPHLLEISGESFSKSTNSQDEARLDFSARSFWQHGERAFFDVRVFNPFAPSHLNQDLQKSFNANEKEKKRTYNRRVVEVEHGSFTPLIFTPYGGTSRETEKFVTTLAWKIAQKRDLMENSVVHWIRTKLSFTLIKSAILCIRGSRSLRTTKINTDIDNIEISNEITKLK